MLDIPHLIPLSIRIQLTCQRPGFIANSAIFRSYPKRLVHSTQSAGEPSFSVLLKEPPMTVDYDELVKSWADANAASGGAMPAEADQAMPAAADALAATEKPAEADAGAESAK